MFVGDDEAYALRLMDEDIIVAPGSSFGAGVEECRRAIGFWEALVP